MLLTPWKQVSEMTDETLKDLLESADPSQNARVHVDVFVQEQQLIASLIAKDSGSRIGRLWRAASRARKSFLAACLVALVAFFGTGSTIVARNLLDDFWTRSIDDLNCDVSGNNARLVRSGVDSIGKKTEYWVVKSGSSVVDVIIQDLAGNGVGGGSLSCDHHARKVNEPFVSYSAYAGDDGVAHVAYFGWIPPMTNAVVEIENGNRVPIESNGSGDVLAFSDQKNMVNLMPRRLTLLDESQQESAVIELHQDNE